MCAPWDVWQCLEILVATSGAVTGTQSVEVRRGAKHPAVHRTVPTTETYPVRISWCCSCRWFRSQETQPLTGSSSHSGKLWNKRGESAQRAFLGLGLFIYYMVG